LATALILKWMLHVFRLNAKSNAVTTCEHDRLWVVETLCAFNGIASRFAEDAAREEKGSL
jgi:hypothetical protein